MLPEHSDILATRHDELVVGSFDVRGAIFVVPIDAPLPSELSGVDVPSGSLYVRLHALDSPEEGTFSFVPLSGAELLSLDRVWRLLQTAKRVFVLTGLPGARYDVLFSQATRQIGLQSVDWPAVSEAIASKLVSNQRLRDKTPWAEPTSPSLTGDPALSPKARRTPRSSSVDHPALPVPLGSDDEDQA